MDTLTKSQRKLLVLIKRYEKENDGWHPTLRDLISFEDSPHKSTSSVGYAISGLEEKGYVERRPTKPAVRLSEKGRRFLNENPQPRHNKHVKPWRK